MEMAKQRLNSDSDTALTISACNNFAKQLQQRATNPTEWAKWAKTSLPALHQQLSADPRYLDNLSIARNEPLQRYSDSGLLFENRTMKASLVAIDKGRGLPLHDHPGASGLMLVIDGSVSVCHCNIKPRQPGELLSLSVLQTDTLNEGETSWFTKTERNVHSVEATSQRAVLLVVHTPAFAAQQQSYYFPINISTYEYTTLHVQRIGAQTLDRISKQKTAPQVLQQNPSH
jgi:hypothetical protein